MFIDIHDLELRPVEFDREFQPGSIDLGPDVTQSAPLHAEGHAELLKEHRGGRAKPIEDIRIVAGFSTTIQMSCARCLEPVTRDVKRDFDLIYRPQGVDAGQEELSVTQAEAEIGYYVGDGLDLGDVLREQLVLALPYKVVCREDCKGLCPHCGKDLNAGPCDCKPQTAEPRWDALKNFKI
jgi:uncharacterized protein